MTIHSGKFALPLARRFGVWCVAALFACASTQAFAFKLFTVGGDNCSFNSIQAAIDAATDSDGNSILVARNYTYTNQALVITNRNVNILGGLDTCASSTYGAQIPIVGESGHSVIEIEGASTVYISGLDISGADIDGNHRGGGIFFGGNGTLELANVYIHGNRAGYGGGIDVSPSGGGATVTLISSLIDANTASGQGGGIRVEGQTTLNIDNATYITGNVATGQNDVGFGGGIEMVGPAIANINANINNNSAVYGGGIAALAANTSPAVVNLYTTSATAVATLYANTASSLGGGIYLKGSRDGVPATLCANSFAIDANHAVDGAAIYADADSGVGSIAYLNSSVCPPPSGAVACVTGALCNEIADNVSTGSGSGIVTVQSDGVLYGNRFAARRNTSDRLMTLNADTDVASLIVSECLLVDNTLTSNLLWGGGGASNTDMFVHFCTISNNQLGSSDPVIYADVSRLEIFDSIIDQPAQSQSLAFTGSSGNLFLEYVLTNNTSSFVGGTGVMQGAPVFVNSSGGDYHQQRTSPGVDVAPAFTDTDLDGNPRPVDLTDRPNVFGPTDLGAYEIQTQLPPSSCSVSDTIFCNGFEITI